MLMKQKEDLDPGMKVFCIIETWMIHEWSEIMYSILGHFSEVMNKRCL